MKNVLFLTLMLVLNQELLAQFTFQNNEAVTNNEIVAPVARFSNELRIANTFMAGDPSIGTMDNSGDGINLHRTNGIGFAFNGVHQYLFTPQGEFSAPVALLSNELRIANTFMAGDPAIGTLDNSGNGINIHKTSGIGFAFNGTHKVLFRPSGNVAIQGKLEAKEIKVTTSPTADFVFEENYELSSLKEVESYISKHKHLPEIASAKEMEKNGVNVGEFQIQLLQKIEELTLYIIQMNKDMTELKAKNKRLEEKVQSLENE